MYKRDHTAIHLSWPRLREVDCYVLGNRYILEWLRRLYPLIDVTLLPELQEGFHLKGGQQLKTDVGILQAIA